MGVQLFPLCAPVFKKTEVVRITLVGMNSSILQWSFFLYEQWPTCNLALTISLEI